MISKIPTVTPDMFNYHRITRHNIQKCNKKRPRQVASQYSTGWRPVVAAYQWWPFAFCTRNYPFDATQIRPFCKRKQKKHLQKRLSKFSAKEANNRQFYQPTLIPTPLQFRGMTIFEIHIIKYRNKHVQIAALIFFYHENL